VRLQGSASQAIPPSTPPVRPGSLGQQTTKDLSPDEFSSMQGRTMTEESYKRLANSVREVTGVDATPEAWKEIINGYMIGPLTGIAMTFNEPGEKGPAPTNREQLGLWDAFGASRMLKKNAREVETLFYTEARPEERDIPGRSGRHIQVAPVPRVHRSNQSRSARPGESLPRQ
jgi:hypothetical protein